MTPRIDPNHQFIVPVELTDEVRKGFVRDGVYIVKISTDKP